MTRQSLLALLLIGILLTSCGGNGEATPDVKATIDANAQTMVAALFQTQTALAPAATNTALPTLTPLPSSTALTLSSPTIFATQVIYYAASPTPTGTYYTATPLSSSLAVGCKNLAVINNWTEPDSPLNPGQSFTQFWQVENNGTCDWMYTYTLEFASGTKFGETTSVKVGKKITPDKWTTFQVNMHAPNKSGDFQSSWRMTDGAGTQFGAVLLVDIEVGGPTKTPKPDTDATNTAAAAQTIAAAAQQTIAAQNAINTAVAQTVAAQQTQAAIDATATANCAGTQTAGGTCP